LGGFSFGITCLIGLFYSLGCPFVVGDFMYIVIGGIFFRGYTGTASFTSLKIVGNAVSKENAKKIVQDNYEDCGGLIIVVNSETGQIADV
jgi:hypothetical protein